MRNTDFRFISDSLCVDFVNTRKMVQGVLTDLLTEPQDLFDWLVESGVVDEKNIQNASQHWEEQAPLLFKQALAFREDLQDLAAGAAFFGKVPIGILQAVNYYLKNPPIYQNVVGMGMSFESETRFAPSTPEHLLFPIAESARQLLTSKDLHHIKQCNNDGCVLFFVDTSKNHSRRWCSMETCGNRQKAAAHYRRNQSK